MAKNIACADKKAWSRWSANARRVFNRVYSRMTKDRVLYLHPKAAVPRKDHWDTTARNAAWEAADAVDQFKIEMVR